jgi:streptomycin 6-kinase
MDPVAVPERLMTSVRALGPAGSRWLEDLPDILASLAADWSIGYGRPLGGGNAAARQLTAVASTLARGWRRVPAGRLPTGAAKAEWLAGFAAREWANLGRPCSQAAAETAVSYAARRAAALDPERAVLVHGDGHAGNLLLKPDPAGGGTSFRLIDPEGLISEPAHDLGVALRDRNEELLAADTAVTATARCRRTALLTGVDGEAIWEWAFIERVSTGLFLFRLGHRREARPFLAVADRLSASRYSTR